jgi:hypothetical protein
VQGGERSPAKGSSRPETSHTHLSASCCLLKSTYPNCLRVGGRFHSKRFRIGRQHPETAARDNNPSGPSDIENCYIAGHKQIQNSIDLALHYTTTPAGAFTMSSSNPNSAKQPQVYQIDFTAVASGKRIASSKRRVRW